MRDELRRECKLRVKVFNSFVEKRVEIELESAESGREFNAKCTLHHVCAEASEYCHDIFIWAESLAQSRRVGSQNLTNHLRFKLQSQRTTFCSCDDRETRLVRRKLLGRKTDGSKAR
jgi:hypothetical protein